MKIQLIDFGGRSPERAHANDAGADVFSPKDVGRILRTFKIKKNVEVTDNGKIII